MDIAAQTVEVVANVRSSLGPASSTSTFDVPTCESATLLYDLLPSDDSGKWSGETVSLPVSEDLKAVKHNSVSATTPKPVRKSADKISVKERRKTLCIPDMVSRRRETPVIGRRLTQDHSVKATAPKTYATRRDKVLSTLGEMDDSSASALGRIDSAMDQLQKERERLDHEPPSLVVSTSRTTRSISVDDFVILDQSPLTLASRRGKNVPCALQLQTTSPNNVIDYPDVPTPFQCATTPNAQAFSATVVPKYPELVLDKKMSAEQMINSLRNQVENFRPQSSNSNGRNLESNVEDAEAWLKDELRNRNAEDGRDILSSCPAGPFSPAPCTSGAESCEPSMLAYMNSTSREINVSTSLAPATPDHSQHKLSSPEPDDFLSPQVSLKQSTPRVARHCRSMPSVSTPKPRRSILSDGMPQASSVRKKVRFSSVQPETISSPPLAVFDPPSVVAPQTPSVRSPLSSPPKRKPPPLVSMNKPSVPSQALQPPSISTPRRLAPRARELSPLNPNRSQNKALPGVPTPVRPTSTPTQRRFSTICGPAPSIKEKPTTPLNKKYSLSQTTVPPRGPLIFSNAANKEVQRIPARNDSLSNNDALHRQSIKGKENTRLFPGISITRKRSFTTPAPVEKRMGAQVPRCADKESQKKAVRRSMPFQSMLNRFRG